MACEGLAAWSTEWYPLSWWRGGENAPLNIKKWMKVSPWKVADWEPRCWTSRMKLSMMMWNGWFCDACMACFVSPYSSIYSFIYLAYLTVDQSQAGKSGRPSWVRLQQRQEQRCSVAPGKSMFEMWKISWGNLASLLFFDFKLPVVSNREARSTQFRHTFHPHTKKRPRITDHIL